MGRLLSRPALFFVIPLTVAVAADSVRLEFHTLSPQVIEQRLETVPQTLAERKAVLVSLFHEVGCETAEQPVPHSKAPNLICTLPGETGSTIVVGGHFDFITKGTGAFDDWSGVVMLPSLYETLKSLPRHHRFVFVAFAAEEDGLFGSKEYVKKLSPEEKTAIHGMINLECLGATGPKVWASRADQHLLADYTRAAQALNLPAVASNVDNVGDDDSHPFLQAKIPVLTIHSVTQETIGLLHNSRDNLKAIHPGDYYDSYRLAATLLALLDAE